MQATKEQIVLAGIFGVGIVALGVDRLVLSDGVSGPAHASAITTTLATPALVAPATAKVSPSLSQRLRALALYENLDVSPRSDAFSLDDRHAALRPSTKGESRSTTEQNFRQAHRLIGVMADRGSQSVPDSASSLAAFIEIKKTGQVQPTTARLIRGDVIGGFTVVALGTPGTDKASSSFVELERNGVTFRLFATNGT